MYTNYVTEAQQRNLAKEPVTIRLDVEAKTKLNEIAKAENRTVSSLIDLAVREFLDRRSGAESKPEFLRVRHADLPDTSVLRAFCTLAEDEANQARAELNLPAFKFVDEDRPEWSRLPIDLFRGESHLVESVNWLPIFLHVKGGGGSPRLDWVGPYLQLFVGHCVFVSTELAANYLDSDQIKAFAAFHAQGRTGKDLSLRSLIAWARMSDSKPIGEALDAMWHDSVVGCQLGTDYHIAIRRVAPILAELAGKGADAATDPTIPGITDLKRGFQEFRNGTISAFCGNLLHSAELLSDRPQAAFLLAGPADVRVPSLNTLAGTKGMFETTSAQDPSANGMGGNVLTFWSRAVRWFRDGMINSNSDTLLRQFLSSMFKDFLVPEAAGAGSPEAADLDRVQVLKGLLQTWVRWFADPAEARSFIGDGVVEGMMGGSVSARDLVQYYEELCDLLNPAIAMKAPQLSEPRERALWRFPAFSERARTALTQPVLDAGHASVGGKGKAGKIGGGGERPPKR